MPLHRVLLRAAIALASTTTLILAGYLALNVPGRWFPSADPVDIDPGRFAVSRGKAQTIPGALVVAAPDQNESAVVVTATNLRSGDYAGVHWNVSGVPEDAEVRLLWRSSYRPDRLNIVPMIVDGGRVRPIVIAGDPNWVGDIVGLGIAIRRTPPEGVAVRGVTVRPLGAFEILLVRAGEWLGFEGWRATSVETLAGGSDAQDLPLPLVLAAAIAIAVAAIALKRRFDSGTPSGVPLATYAIALFAVAWIVLDLRWGFNLVRQSIVTAQTFGGKSVRDAHLAAEDAALYRLASEARDKLPSGPVRVFVLGEAPYFRARAAYYLYPHNPWFDLNRSGLPDHRSLRAGDWVFTYRRRGVQYNQATQHLRWEGSAELPAELMLVTADGALFKLR